MTVAEQELNRFHHFARERLRERANLSLEELLDLYRIQNPSDQRRADDLAAVRAALRDWDEGEVGLPYDQFVREFRKLNGIPSGQ
jgi:hypothetical protein